MISHELSLIQERSADRAMIEAATAEFLQRGEIQVLGIIINRDIALNDFKTGPAFEDRQQVRERVAREQFDKAKASIALRTTKEETRKRSSGPTARQKKALTVQANKDSRDALVAKVAEMAKTMTKAQVAKELGITLSHIRTICKNHDLPFPIIRARTVMPKEDRAAHYAVLAGALAAWRDLGLSRSEARVKMKIGSEVLERILEVSGMDYPKSSRGVKPKKEA